MTITKSELVQVVMQHSEIKRGDAAKFIEDFFEIMSVSLEKGDDVKIPGFGNFMLRSKKARVGRNPKTGEEFPITARRVVTFRPSNILKLAIRDQKSK
ncbi:MAG: integration host factor subunit alpha [Proteobacteria bacterium]|jgi:integration host factor subunit alpha|nr:integration host factor subunit alpha [Pseudomonadota bacterium]